ncbi:phosphate signaling complex protein PhoU [Actinomycetospora corticicola]|jgi:phosphate transport system protein|uniref:Phosphate-specific transport system accessory protein PhoU n=1 Tax=Actinomycetospora corticicola TaxID=663602 RepID=A0A7Y9J7I2_9PSEU|nr:phosphate signaling complex protein PhoU [Actinomycetospora corticicola]NYD38061.1 phosphate transport system protein [Actinomycetospora corticicola]
MRAAYHEKLSSLNDELAQMSLLAGEAMKKATSALLDGDLDLAEEVISSDTEIDALRTSAEDQAFGLLALQAPVAGDLRSVIAAIHSAGDLERMGDLALHVAKAARRRHPELVLPQEVAPYFAEMGRVALDLAQDARRVILDRDVELAFTMESDDDAMDDLHRHLFTVMMTKDWPHGVAPAVDVTLLGRFYERFADHAVAVARRVVFMVTGKMPDPPLA